MTFIPSGSPAPSASKTNDPTPADWMAFAQAMGWSIAAMSTGRPVKFITSTGQDVHVTPSMRADIMSAIERARD